MHHAFGRLTHDAAGKLGEAKPSVPGFDGVFSQLIAEHREVTTLLDQLLAAPHDETRQDLWLELRAAIISHERPKLQEVYSTFQAYPNLEPLVDGHSHQLHALEALIWDLDALPFSVPAWQQAFERLNVALRQHLLLEEKEYFPRAQLALGRDKAEQLKVPYLSAKRSLLAEL